METTAALNTPFQICQHLNEVLFFRSQKGKQTRDINLFIAMLKEGLSESYRFERLDALNHKITLVHKSFGYPADIHYETGTANIITRFIPH
jgi:hypothetical protein